MAKQVTIAFNNPANELNLDHIEIWKKIGVNGTLTKFGTNVPVVSGGTPYSIVDQSADIVDSADVHYEVRTYSPTGEFSLATANILISNVIIPTYTIPWESQFTTFPRDANGYTVLTPSATSQIAFVDPTNGDDATARVYTSADTTVFADPRGVTSGVLAYQTLDAALATRRNNQPDWVLIKRGESLNVSTEKTLLNGLDATNRQVISSYGIGDRPIINCANDFGFINQPTGVKYNTITGLFLYNPYRDHTNPLYVGYQNILGATGITLVATSASPTVEYVLIEDCRIDNFGLAIGIDDIHDLPIGSYSSDIQVRKNVISNSHSYPSHSQGIYLSTVRPLIEDNVFYKCGYVMNTSSGETLTTALTGTAETTVTVDTIPSDAPSSGELAITLDDTTIIYVEYSGFSGSAYTITSTDFSSVNASVGNKAEVALERAVVFNHSSYLEGCENVIMRGNISIHPSSIHHKFTANPILTNAQTATLSVSLTGAAETQVVVDGTIPAENSSTGTIDITLDDATVLAVPYTSYSGDAYTIDATDFSATNASVGNAVRNQELQNIIKSANIAIVQNVHIGGEVSSSFGGNDSNGNGYRFSDVRYLGNLTTKIGKFQPTNRTLGWGAESKDLITGAIEDNIFINTENALITNKYDVLISEYASDITIKNNRSYLAGASFDVDNNNNKNNIDFYENTIDLATTNYIDPTRTIESYNANIGGLNTLDDFSSKCIALSSTSYNSNYSANNVISWVGGGYSYDTSIVNKPNILTDVASASIIENTDVTFSVDAYGASELNYQWQVNGVDLTGEVSHILTVTTVPITADGDIYQCVISNSEGVTTSGQAVLTVLQDRPFLDFSSATGSFASITPAPIGLNTKVEAWYKSAAVITSFKLLGSSANAGLNVSISNSSVTYRGGGANQSIPIPDTLDGAIHYIEVSCDNSGVVTVILDGVTYTGSGDAAFYNENADAINNYNYSSPTDVRIFDIRLTDTSSVITQYNIDSGSTTTEAASVGTGTMTFTNVVITDWVGLTASSIGELYNTVELFDSEELHA